jgi:hypothetical protein
MKTLHTLVDVADIPLPNGCHFKPTERKPYVVASLRAEGSAKSLGVCLRCYEVIPHTEGGSRAMYASHCCKLGRGQKTLPPIPDTSFLKPTVAAAAPVTLPPSATTVTPVITSSVIDWDAVYSELSKDPVAAKLMAMKRTKEVSVCNEDDDEETNITETLGPKETLLAVMKTDATLKRCGRLEHQIQHVSELNENLETELQSKNEALSKAEMIRGNLCQQLAEQQVEIARLKALLAPVIEHA